MTDQTEEQPTEQILNEEYDIEEYTQDNVSPELADVPPSTEDLMQFLQKKKKKTAYEMALAQYTMDSDQPTAVKTAAKKDYEKHSKVYTSILHSIQALAPEETPFTPITDGSGSTVRRREESQKKVFRIAKLTNRFKASSVPNEYWTYFQEQCETYALSDYEAVLLIQANVGEHPKGPLWYSNHVHPRGNSIKLCQLKQSFFNEFLDTDWKTQRMIALLGIIYKRETVKDFVHRFSTLMRGTGFLWEGTQVEHGFLKHVLYYKCPPSVQRLLNGKSPDDFADCASLAKVLTTFPGIPDDVPAEPLCSSCSAKRKREPVPSSLPPGKKTGPKYCSEHGQCGHETKDCRVLKGKKTGDGSTPPPLRRNQRERVTIRVVLRNTLENTPLFVHSRLLPILPKIMISG